MHVQQLNQIKNSSHVTLSQQYSILNLCVCVCYILVALPYLLSRCGFVFFLLLFLSFFLLLLDQLRIIHLASVKSACYVLLGMRERTMVKLYCYSDECTVHAITVHSVHLCTHMYVPEKVFLSSCFCLVRNFRSLVSSLLQSIDNINLGLKLRHA